MLLLIELEAFYQIINFLEIISEKPKHTKKFKIKVDTYETFYIFCFDKSTP